MRNMLHHLREIGLDVLHEGRTAGRGQKPLLRKLLGLSHSDHVRTQSRLDDVVEAQLLQTRNDLAQLGVGELAGDGGSHHGVNTAISTEIVAGAILQDINGVQHEGLVRNRAKGAQVHASAALDALGIVDLGGLLLVHGDSLDLTSILAGTLAVDDSRKGADLGAGAALLALGLVDVGHVITVKGQRTELAHVLATVSQTTAASVGDLVAAYGTFVAGDVDDLNDVGIFLVSTHGQLNALAQNGALLVHTATHGGLFTGRELLGNIHHILHELVFPGKASNLSQHLIFQMLDFCIEFTHD